MTDTPTPTEMPAPDCLTDDLRRHDSATENKNSFADKLITNTAPAMVTPHWVNVDGFILDCIAEMAAPRNWAEADSYLPVVSNLVHWATATASLALDVQEIFHPDTISNFVPTMRPTRGGFDRALNALTQMSETLVHDEQPQVPPPGHGMANFSTFAEADFQGLADWADSLAFPGRRRDADAMLAFSGGAGLTDVELFHARARDIVFRDDGVFIFVPGEFPRSVPVHFFWEDGVRARFSGTAPRAHLILPGVPRSRRRPTGVALGFRSAAADAAQLSTRLRATWLERTAALLDPAAADHFSGFCVEGGPAAARELVKNIDFEASAATLRGAGEGW